MSTANYSSQLFMLLLLGHVDNPDDSICLHCLDEMTNLHHNPGDLAQE